MDAALTRRDRQLAAARAKAIARRQRRAWIRAACKDGRIDPIKLVAGKYEEHEDDLAGWKLEQLLRIVPGIGSATSAEIYEVGPFSPRQLVSSLSPQRRERLAELVEQGRR